MTRVLAALCTLAMPVAAAGAAPGDLDPTFADGGRFHRHVGPKSIGQAAAAVALQPDGKIVLAGGMGGDFAVTRLQPDGSVDTTFGDRGLAVIDFGHFAISDQLEYPSYARGFASAAGVGVAPNGEIVVGGTTYRRGTDFDFAVARLTPSGVLDRTFSRNGKAVLDAGGEYDAADTLVLQPDGRIVLAGRQSIEATSTSRFAVARFAVSGRPDAAFAGDGIRVTDFGGRNPDDRVYGIALQPDGKLVAAGYSYPRNGYEPAVARFNPDGSLDPAFSGNGRRIVKFAGDFDLANAVAVQSTGKIVIAGIASVRVPDTLAVARMEPNGSLDSGFYGDGRGLLGFGGDPAEGHPYSDALALAIQPDDKILIGAYFTTGLFESDIGVIRLLPDGGFDQAFSTDGRQELGLRPRGPLPIGLALQPDRKAVIAAPWGGDFAAVRLLAD